MEGITCWRIYLHVFQFSRRYPNTLLLLCSHLSVCAVEVREETKSILATVVCDGKNPPGRPFATLLQYH